MAPRARSGKPADCCAGGEDGLEGVGHSRQIIVRHGCARAVGQQLDGVRKRRRDDRNARGHRFDENPGCRLLVGLVGQQDGIRRLEHARQVVVRQVPVHELHRIVDAECACETGERLPIGLAAFRPDLGVRLAGDDVVGSEAPHPQQRERADAALETLAGGEQSPGEDTRDRSGLVNPADRGHHHTVGDDADAAQVDVVPRRERLEGVIRHDDDGRRECSDPLEHPPLVRQGRRQNRVQHDDRGHIQRLEHRDHLLAIRPAEDAVLVLHDHHVAAAEGARRGAAGCRIVQPDLRHHPAGVVVERPAIFLIVEHPDDRGRRVSRAGERMSERAREGREPAPRGWVRGDEAEARHRDLLSTCPGGHGSARGWPWRRARRGEAQIRSGATRKISGLTSASRPWHPCRGSLGQ